MSGPLVQSKGLSRQRHDLIVYPCTFCGYFCAFHNKISHAQRSWLDFDPILSKRRDGFPSQHFDGLLEGCAVSVYLIDVISFGICSVYVLEILQPLHRGHIFILRQLKVVVLILPP